MSSIEVNAQSVRNRSSGRVAQYILAIVFIGVLIGLLVMAIQSTRAAVRRAACVENLKQIGVALQNYHNAFKCFPPAYVADADGKPMHSWRALLLPYFEDPAFQELYRQYDFNEPWDGANNRKLAARMPSVFRCPEVSDDRPVTSYAAVVGPETVWPEAQSLRINDVKDGAPRTIMVVEVANSGIPWMEPRDMTFEDAIRGINPHGAATDQQDVVISSNHSGGANILFVDGSVHFLQDVIDPELLRDLLTAASDKEVYIPDC